MLVSAHQAHSKQRHIDAKGIQRQQHIGSPATDTFHLARYCHQFGFVWPAVNHMDNIHDPIARTDNPARHV